MLEKARWQEELDTYRSIKKMFILEGNVSDHQMLNFGIEAGVLVDLEEYLHAYFLSQGYHSVVFYNRIDGFYNRYDYEGKMVSIFKEQAELTGFMKKTDIQSSMEGVRKAIGKANHSVAVVIQMAGQLIGNAEHLEAHEMEYLSTLLLAANEACAGAADNQDGWVNNLVIMITNRVQELPTWFYRYSPYCKVLNIEYPKDKLRRHLITSHKADFPDWDHLEEDVREKQVKHLIARTDGFTCVELNSILGLCEGKELRTVDERVCAYRHGRKDNPWEELTQDKIVNMVNELSKSVIGQPKAVQAAVDVVTRAATGMAGIQSAVNNRPRGILLFAGPTGTGKTELAKSLAREVFGSESAMIRFDMSEYSQSHSDQRLLGAPPGYVGYDAGGELTNAVKEHPFSILLFDEIEKANPSILDKFLQILDDGRMTDSKGETVYFSECIIIFTSNLGLSRTLPDGTRENLVDASATMEEIERTVVNQLHKCWRPEFLNRMGNNIIIFDFIRKEQAKLILDKQLKQICDNLFDQKNIRILVSEDSEIYQSLYKACCENLEFGGRGVRNVVEYDFITPLSRELSRRSWIAGDQVCLEKIEKNEYESRFVYRILNRS